VFVGGPREVGKPTLLVGCKSSDREVSPSLGYLKQRFPAAHAWQISAEGQRDFVSREGAGLAPALTLLAALV
jgi:hypothetical protein